MISRAFNFFEKSGKEKDALVLDFGNGSVKGFLSHPENGGVAISDFSEANIKKYGVFNSRNFNEEIITSPTQEVLKDLGVKKPSKFRTIISFSPEIIRANLFNISFHRDAKNGKINKIDEKEEKQIYARVLEDVRNEFSDELECGGIPSIRIIKKSILTKKAAGYEVTSLVGISEKELEFKILTISCCENHWRFIEQLERSIKIKDGEIFHTAEALASYFADAGTFVDVGARNTMIIAFKGTLSFIKYFPFGGYNFTEALIDSLGMSETRAEQLKIDFASGRLSAEVKNKIEDILNPVFRKWRDSFEKEISSASVPFMVEPIYLLGGGSLLPGIRESVGEIGSKAIKYLSAENIGIKNKTNIHFTPRHIPSLMLAFCL